MVDDQRMQLLVASRGSVDATERNGRAEAMESRIAKILAARARRFIDERNAQGCTALHLAAEGGAKGEVQELLGKGATVNAKTETQYLSDGIKNSPHEDELTPLDLAVRGGHGATVQLLIDNGADVNLKANDADKKRAALPDRTGSAWSNPPFSPRPLVAHTSLHYAVQFGNAAIVKQLLDKGARLEVKNKYGYTLNPET